MHTENDLRDAILDRARHAPTSLPVLDVDRTRPVRPRATVAVGVAVLAAAAVAIVPVALHRDHHRTPAAAAPATSPTASPPTTTPPPLLVHSRTWISYSGTDVTATVESIEAQYIELVTDQHSVTEGVPDREVVAFAPGLFSTSLISHPTPVTVNGQSGYFGAILPWYNDDLPHAAANPTPNPDGSKYPSAVPAVVWKIGPDQWAAVLSTTPAENNPAALLAIAAKVHVEGTAVLSPLEVGYLPAGEKLSDVEYSQPNDEYAGTSSVLGFRRDTDQDYYNWAITYTPVATGGSPGVTPVNPVLTRTVGSYVVTVDTRGAISDADAQRVLDSITVAPQPHEPNSTWFDLAAALP